MADIRSALKASTKLEPKTGRAEKKASLRQKKGLVITEEQQGRLKTLFDFQQMDSQLAMPQILDLLQKSLAPQPRKKVEEAVKECKKLERENLQLHFAISCLQKKLDRQKKRLEKGLLDGQDEESDEAPGICRVCFERPVAIRMNCGHAVCATCKPFLKGRCHNCRGVLHAWSPLFL